MANFLFYCCSPSEWFEKMNYYNIINKKIKIIRIFENFIQPCEIEISFKAKSLDDENQTVSCIKKMNIFIDEILECSVFISHDSPLIDLFLENDNLKVANNVVLLPKDPLDDVIAAVLFSKLKSLFKDFIEIDDFRLTSSLFYESEIIFEDDSDDYIKSFPYVENVEIPWWKRNDFTTRDYLEAHEEENKPNLEMLKLMIEEEKVNFNKRFTEIIQLGSREEEDF